MTFPVLRPSAVVAAHARSLVGTTLASGGQQVAIVPVPLLAPCPDPGSSSDREPATADCRFPQAARVLLPACPRRISISTVNTVSYIIYHKGGPWEPTESCCCNSQAANHFGCGTQENCGCSTGAVGKDQGAKGCFNQFPQRAHNVPGRP